jgi:hypothetical protein
MENFPASWPVGGGDLLRISQAIGPGAEVRKKKRAEELRQGGGTIRELVGEGWSGMVGAGNWCCGGVWAVAYTWRLAEKVRVWIVKTKRLQDLHMLLKCYITMY